MHDLGVVFLILWLIVGSIRKMIVGTKVPPSTRPPTQAPTAAPLAGAPLAGAQRPAAQSLQSYAQPPAQATPAPYSTSMPDGVTQAEPRSIQTDALMQRAESASAISPAKQQFDRERKQFERNLARAQEKEARETLGNAQSEQDRPNAGTSGAIEAVSLSSPTALLRNKRRLLDAFVLAQALDTPRTRRRGRAFRV